MESGKEQNKKSVRSRKDESAQKKREGAKGTIVRKAGGREDSDEPVPVPVPVLSATATGK